MMTIDEWYSLGVCRRISSKGTPGFVSLFRSAPGACAVASFRNRRSVAPSSARPCRLVIRPQLGIYALLASVPTPLWLGEFVGLWRNGSGPFCRRPVGSSPSAIHSSAAHGGEFPSQCILATRRSLSQVSRGNNGPQSRAYMRSFCLHPYPARIPTLSSAGH